MTSEGKKKRAKVVIMGMENAGKSTLVQSIVDDLDDVPTAAPNMTPTMSTSITTYKANNKKIAIWDFGGQEVYRKEYMEKPEVYFQEISVVFYVVDVQDHAKLQSSEMYFTGVFQLMRQYSPNVNIVFLFHKTDPDFKVGAVNVKQEFTKYVETFLKKHNKTFKVYDTTIFQPKSITEAFSREVF